ncbi:MULTISPECIES: ABC transporter ATP-binding protein [Actinomadura]|uniref:NitT/TauT family transport system ATP-binding protein n=1 Tax=Actinomadura madurae TaxID=1993 RepID=A0A1I5XTY4_9ACTN|nr:ABC transporter ATP-binding protein [Actinomadura madurae]MCP9948095.1 ABC transporter ATP-binding protein [Actinomadura madurae]MCP9964865.1 ABC transporter ATP-binding protein [Actinomadura madurae]MCP9977354.1 ABC transporter ATP-binding protein [Actinomadura madurae]MCQ0011141.1 ABC transporter ATP-binding protein [Actinomadura madurae]MCQ0013534.1 ABC transporter ATP-binding protein [Actinomadura madurae]
MPTPSHPPTVTDVAVELHNVSMRYRAKRGRTVLALDDVSLSVPEGQFVSIVGPSGCGKSTLLKIVMGLTRQTEGEVSFGSARSHENLLGMVFQQPLLLPWRTVAKNMMISHDVGPKRPRADLDKRVADQLDMLGLRDFADQYPTELSGGMQQRVGIGRALLHDPRILLMDEPFGALDAMTRDQMGLDLLDIWERDRKTVLFVTHSIPEAVLLSDRVVVMTPRPGRIAEVIDVGLARPRRLEDINTPEFGDIASRIRILLNSEHSAH